MGYVQRQRDPEDERQVRIRLTASGRQLRDAGSDVDLFEATGLTAEEFTQVQRAVVKLRDNLIRSFKDRE